MKQIYTGYKWRDMKPDEIEIMDATRVRLSIFGEPDAGDIYEGMDPVSGKLLNLNGIQIVPEGVLFTPQNWGKSKRALQEPCVYCNPAFINPFIDDDGLYLFIDKDRLMTGYSDECTFEKSESIKINYCPMCGGKLEVEG